MSANHLHGAMRKSAILVIDAAIKEQDHPAVFPGAEYCLDVWLGERQGDADVLMRLPIIELVERALRGALAP